MTTPAESEGRAAGPVRGGAGPAGGAVVRVRPAVLWCGSGHAVGGELRGQGGNAEGLLVGRGGLVELVGQLVWVVHEVVALTELHLPGAGHRAVPVGREVVVLRVLPVLGDVRGPGGC